MTNRNNRIVGPILKNLVRQIAYLYERDIITVLVSSGSAIAEKEVLEIVRKRINLFVGKYSLQSVNRD